MKKKIYSSLGLMVILATSMVISSCKKYLTENPVAAFSTDAAFSNVSTATDAVLGVYSRLSGDSGYGIRLSMYFTVDNDEMLGATSNTSPDGDRRDIARYGANVTNAQIEAPFENLYAGIERANICIKYIPLMAAYTTGSTSDQASLKRLYGEALTLRAQFYFELIRNWGDVPAQFIPSADMPTLTIPRTDRDVIYDHILADLLTAESLVPYRTAVTRDERITLGAVKGLRARIALFAGGYSLRNTTGTMDRRADYLKYYQMAHDECADLMQHPDQHTLNASYQGLFQTYMDAHTLDPAGEVMFEVAMGGGSGTSDSKLGYYDGPRLLIPTAVAGTYTSYGNSSLFVLPTYFYSFDPNDTRRDVTIVPYYVLTDNTKVLQKFVSATTGKFRRDWIANPSFLASSSTGSQYFGINWPILRFSDVLLMLAETENELNNGPTAVAIAALNQVRARAFNSSNAAIIGVPPAGHDAFFNAIVNERSFELGGEGTRKYDLIRWNLLNTKLNTTRANLTAMINKAAPYANLPQSMYYLPGQTSIVYGNSLYTPTPAATPTGYTKIAWLSSLTNTGTVPYVDYVGKFFVSNHSELLPIPQASLQANPLLTQNPGY